MWEKGGKPGKFKIDKVICGVAATTKNVGGRGGFRRVEQIQKKQILLPSDGLTGNVKGRGFGPNEPSS